MSKTPPADGTLVAALLMCVALVSRAMLLGHPATPIFDETHVGRFLNWYHQGAFFFDVHPPLPKLLMYAVARAVGFEGGASCPYESTRPFAAHCDLAPVRLAPALAGAALVPLAAATAERMGLARHAALLAAWLVLSDPLFVTLSRLHMNDVFLCFFVALTHYAALGAACTQPDSSVEPLPLAGASLRALTATGVALGCALSCKYGAPLPTLAWLGLQCLHLLAALALQGRPVSTVLAAAVARGVLLLGLPLCIYLAAWAVHLRMLPLSGDGDGYLPVAFQATLVGSRFAPAAAAAADAHQPGLLRKVYDLTRAQVRYNRNMASAFPRGSHHFDSPWYHWPLARRGVYVPLVTEWEAIASAPSDEHLLGLYIGPNPFTAVATACIAIVVALALAGSAVAQCLRPKSAAAMGAPFWRAWRPGGAGSLLVAYLLHWLPYATQQRQTFQHYYLPAYYFAILLAAAVWDAGCRLLPEGVRAALTAALAAAVGWTAAELLPLAYAAPSRPLEWEGKLRLASTDCWGEASRCWL